jgi:maltose/moltooligosaccharide transporter
VTARHYGTVDTASAAYNAGADWVGVLFAGYNGVAALAAFPAAAGPSDRTSRQPRDVPGDWARWASPGFVLIDDPMLLWIPIIGIGLAWASIMSAPYAMLSSAVPPGKMGVYMGIHNLFLVIPQLVAATVLGAPGRPPAGRAGDPGPGPGRRRLRHRGRLALTIQDARRPRAR